MRLCLCLRLAVGYVHGSLWASRRAVAGGLRQYSGTVQTKNNSPLVRNINNNTPQHTSQATVWARNSWARNDWTGPAPVVGVVIGDGCGHAPVTDARG